MAFFDRERELLSMLAKVQMTVAGKAQLICFCSPFPALYCLRGQLAGRAPSTDAESLVS
jgi:hypothetical protein